MKTIFVLFLIGLSMCVYERKTHEEIVKKVNEMNTTWKAKYYGEDFKPFFGVIKPVPEDKKLPRKVFKTRKALPISYDLRKEFPQCETLTEIRDQSRCGACWAFSAVEVMSDRLCIHSKGKIQTRVSAQNVLTCCDWCGNGCFGGWPGSAFEFWQEEGIPSGGNYGDENSCQPYWLPECDDHMHKCHDYQPTPRCERQCQAGFPTPLQEDKTYGAYSYSLYGEDDIMQEIYENGSVTAVFDIYEDFADYHAGIYQHVHGGSMGGSHAVKIIGWGVEDNLKYWIIANSWNPTWGESGYFRMRRGVDECGIESMIDAAIPRL